MSESPNQIGIARRSKNLSPHIYQDVLVIFLLVFIGTCVTVLFHWNRSDSGFPVFLDGKHVTIIQLPPTSNSFLEKKNQFYLRKYFTIFIVQVGLKLIEIHLPLLPSAGIKGKACSTTTWQYFQSFKSYVAQVVCLKQ